MEILTAQRARDISNFSLITNRQVNIILDKIKFHSIFGLKYCETHLKTKEGFREDNMPEIISTLIQLGYECKSSTDKLTGDTFLQITWK